MFPLQILKNGLGKAVSIELTNGEFVNGTLSRSDMTMNLVLRNAIRCGSNGETFWSAKEALIRGSSIIAVRLDPEALVPPRDGRGGARGGRGGRGGARGANRGGRGGSSTTGDGASNSRGGRSQGGRGGRGGGRGDRGGRGGARRGRGGVKRDRES